MDLIVFGEENNMAKTKKTKVVQETDYQLLKKIKAGDEKAKWELFERYKLLMFKQYHTFKKICIDNNYTGIEYGTPESFMYDCWEPYQKALDTSELSKIDHCPIYDCKKKPNETMTQWRARRKVVGYEDHSDKWKFWITFWGYIKKQNEVTISHYLNDCNSTIRINQFSSDGEEYNSLDLNMPHEISNSTDADFEHSQASESYNKAINSAYKKFNSVQKKIWNFRQNEMSRTDILKNLGISSKVYNQNFEAMRNIVNFEINKENMKTSLGLAKI